MNMDAAEKIELMRRMREEALQGGGPERIEAQRKAGKKTARERVVELFDSGTFVEQDMFVSHLCSDFGMQDRRSLATGSSRAMADCGRDVYVLAGLHGVRGSWEMFAEDHEGDGSAMKNGAPVVGLNDSGNAHQEGVVSLGTPRSSFAT
jgi:propionyl-CoA carboxylase beta chain